MVSVPWLLSCWLDTQTLGYILLFGLLAIVIYTKLRGKDVFFNPQGRAVLITGCDSGFGNLLALRLLDMGFTVFAACLFPDGDGAQALINHSSPGQVKVIRLDVTSDEEMEKVKQYVKENLPDKGLWGLVNNAGISMWGMVEWLTIDKYQKVLNVNLLGSIRTTLAFAPLIRKNKGRMVFLSSTNAYIGMLNGIYSMSKAGLEKFCDCLRLEMKQFGVQVCIIEPGNYAPATNIQPLVGAEQIWAPLSAELKEIFSKESVERTANFVRTRLESGSRKSYEVVDAIIDALTSPSPKPRYLVASLVEQLTYYLYLWLPTSLFDQILLSAVRKIGWS
ncbi:retinol dehydrogenase 7-like isoform X1 [Dendrobates tinctorius]|uniref:retinol dehydrogenase 7-like isoform X1 n=1 Tax=Dendrobates tinctorius TaxID=92724 RepID=UPI003CCA4916